MADKSKKLERLLRLQTQINRASEAKLAAQIAEEQRLDTELENLDELITRDSMVGRLFPDVCASRSTRITDEKRANAIKKEALSTEIAVGRSRSSAYQRRLDESVRTAERKKLELESVERLTRKTGDGEPVSRKA